VSEEVPAVPAVAATFAARLPEVVDCVGLYAAGSLATGDYRHGVSDLDLVALIHRPIAPADRRRLQALHGELVASDPTAAALHCAYVLRSDVADLAQAHLTWAHGEFLLRPLTAIARAELGRGGIALVGPPCAATIPPVTHQQMAAAARCELEFYRRFLTRRPWVWLHDEWVDLGLTTLVRADVTIGSGALLTKSAAIERLAASGAPAWLVADLRRRRAGGGRALGPLARVRRAVATRRIMAAGLARRTR
jgi:hypothetical protein